MNTKKMAFKTLLLSALISSQAYAADIIIKNANVFDGTGSDLIKNANVIIENGKVQKGPNYWKPEPMIQRYIEAEIRQHAAQHGADS